MTENSSRSKILIIGAGIGGLTTAAVLSKSGFDVTVLESQVYPGGCASTFYHKGYRFDAGATLAAGFYPGGPMDLLGEAAGITNWPIHYDSPAMVVHLPNGQQIPCLNEESRWEDYCKAFGKSSVDFFRWQEETAELLWRFALRLPAWPIKNIRDVRSVIRSLDGRIIAASPRLAWDVFNPVSKHLRGMHENLKMFIDGQLLISAQTTSEYANALYSASALDLPRRGVGHLDKGIGTLADILVNTIRNNGGRVVFRQEVTKVSQNNRQNFVVETRKKLKYEADIVIANLTPWNLAEMMQNNLPKSLIKLPVFPEKNWGAFMLYLGIDSAIIPKDLPLHHQVIHGLPLGEGNSVFISISPEWDTTRAPDGQRALTISTHTRLDNWWKLFESDKHEYLEKKELMTEKVLEAVEQVLPGVRNAVRLLLPGTPITFKRYTGRAFGWVGGFPQTSLFESFHPKIADNLWLVGDSIFPGQSTAAVALGGLRVAKEILEQVK
jgi:C-3',4' desaturase CrtD